ncbi:MAG: glycoside hydrolase family 3 C-terminal domain-containing protein [Bacteroidales bacterium]|nr:glycoside hydrolase family 3 C-terminal domain-containing protein [Bacteroidales bacterium]
MKRILLISSLILLASCSGGDWHDASLPAEKRVRLLLKEMTLEEKIGQMCQYVGPCYVPPDQGSPYKNIDASDENLGDPDMANRVREGKVGSFLHVLTGEEAHQLQLLASESRLAIPLIFGLDAIHGNGLRAGCTVYPSNINLASTFRPEIMEEIGAQTAIEMRKTAMVWTFSPNLDVARDARWGRMGETFGEDPWLVSQMGKYMIWGLQGRERNYSEGKVMACAKHLIAGGEPFGGLNASPMDISERKLRELHLPPFKVAVEEAHVATVMTAHNEINGIPCHGNSWLINDLLRDELGFDGFVVSDWMDIERMHSMHHWVPSEDEAFKVSVEAGIDMHMQGPHYFESILDGVRSGRIPEKRIDEAAGKILKAKFELGLFEDPIPELPSERGFTAIPEHRQTSLNAAREGIVLLKNDGTLPLPTVIPSVAKESKPIQRIFLCGPNCDSQTILGDWVVPQDEDDVITVFEGLQAVCPGVKIDTMCFRGRVTAVDDAGIRTAAAKAQQADVNILVLGDNTQRYSAFGRTSGENCDRDNLDLPGRQQELLEAVAASGRPTVLILMSGRALGVVWAVENPSVNAILNVWEPGQMGGQAIAEILFGLVNPSGKLPVTMPRNAGQIQCVYNHKHSQYSRQFALGVSAPLYPFGYGLSYTTFEYGEPQISKDVIGPDESATVSIRVSNTGAMDGAEAVQLYIRDEYGSVTRPVKELKAVQKPFLKAGESVDLCFEITPAMLECWGANEEWTVEPGDFTIMVGSSSADEDLKSVKLCVK